MTKIKIDPQITSRAEAFSLWMSSPMPMVTLTKTLDVSRLLRVSKSKGIKFNALLCWCIGKAASHIDEFYLLPEQGELFKYDKIAVNVIVNNARGGINSCDIAYTSDLNQFIADYTRLTTQTSSECLSSFLDDHLIIGTSALVATQLDSIINQYTDKFSNPMVMWGRYRQSIFKTTLPISFQFHHVQMDGGHAAHFLEHLQRVIKSL